MRDCSSNLNCIKGKKVFDGGLWSRSTNERLDENKDNRVQSSCLLSSHGARLPDNYGTKPQGWNEMTIFNGYLGMCGTDR